jgi:hypothetical protein
MKPKSLSAEMILVPAGAREALGVGAPEGESCAVGLEMGEGDLTDEAPPGGAESAVVDRDVDEAPQPATSRQSTRTKLLMRQV